MNELLQAIQAEPLTFALCTLAILVGGIGLGYLARRNEERLDAPPPCSPMRTANSSLVDLQTRRVLKNAGVRPHARAGRSSLKPSYDGRAHQADAPQPPDLQPRA